MKCSSCSGTGTWGKVFVENDLVDTICPHCKGTGMVQPTNEEWFCGLSTEEKANLIYDLLWNRNRSLFGEIGYVRDVDAVRKWLKQPHREE